MSVSTTSIQQLAINTIRTLAMDAVEKAKSGHPGTPMALAPVAYTLWNQFLKYDPADPMWLGRDRFILSCGHASMLLYATLHLAGVRQVDHDGKVLDEAAIPLDQIKQFRQLHSRCAGHPEHGEAGGIETTTGPLGQGVGNSVGMAIAERWLAARFNRPSFDLFDYNVYALCSDGDLMEGISHEAASIAGHLKLSNLCWIYDDNGITIEGHTSLAYSDDVPSRFRGYNWHVVQVDDANDLAAIGNAIEEFQRTDDRPTLIIVKSHIGYGAPHKQDSNSAHGEPLGEDEVRATKAVYGWPQDAKFLVPPEVLEHFANCVGARGRDEHATWSSQFAAYAKKYPAEAAEIAMMVDRKLPAGWEEAIPTFPADAKGMATRVSGGKTLDAIASKIPWLMGGAADLAPSTRTLITGATGFESDDYSGRNFHFGIREHGMGAALNGMALSNLRPFGATFFVFTDYMRPSMRLASIMKLPVLYVMTHDSIGVGEDGPTHQPIEHLSAMRAIPNMVVMRPGDANEVAEAYRAALKLLDRPVTMVLSRQNVPTLDRTKYAAASGTARGAYVLADAPGGKPAVIIMSTGTELATAVDAYEKLKAEGVKARVVSMPSMELFESQDAAYREQVLPASVTARVAIEAGAIQSWYHYLGPKGQFVGMSGFGASAPAGELMKYFGLTAENVMAKAKAALAAR